MKAEDACSCLFLFAQVAPVDTVAPATPTDSSVVSTPVTPQAGAEDSTDQHAAVAE